MGGSAGPRRDPDGAGGRSLMSRVALVTGGTRGIGLGCAKALAADGWDLAVCGVRAETEVRPALEELRAMGREVAYVQADIAADDAAGRLVDAVRRRFGRLDVLVNNAGVAPTERRDILDATRESFDRLIRTNLRGPYFLTQAVARWMIEQATADPAGDPAAASALANSAAVNAARRCVIFITSISATVASINRGEYCMSKAGLSMASRLWATRLAPEGILVYEVRPGIVKTDMTAGVAARYDALIEQGLMLQKRWGYPQDIGKAVAMLARGDLTYSTGQIILVDGGMGVERL